MKKQIYEKIEAILLVFSIAILVVACKKQKMQDPPKEFQGVKFEFKASEQKDGPIPGVTFLLTTYAVEVVVASVDSAGMHVKFPSQGTFHTFFVPLKDVNDVFYAGDSALLKMEYFDSSSSAKWRFHLVRKL